MNNDDVEMDSPSEIPGKGKERIMGGGSVNPEPDADIKELFNKNPTLTIREFFHHMWDSIQKEETNKLRLEKKRLNKPPSAKAIEDYLAKHEKEFTLIGVTRNLATLGEHTQKAVDEGAKKDKAKIKEAFGYLRLYVFTIGPQELMLQKDTTIGLAVLMPLGRYGEALAMEGKPFRFDPVSFHVEESLQAEAAKLLLTMMITEQAGNALRALHAFRHIALPHGIDDEYPKLDLYQKIRSDKRGAADNVFTMIGTVLITQGASWDDYQRAPHDYRKPLDEYITSEFGQERVSDLEVFYAKTSALQVPPIVPFEAEQTSAFNSNFERNPKLDALLNGNPPITKIGELFSKLSSHIPPGLLRSKDEEGSILFDAMMADIDPSMDIREVMASPLTYFDASRTWTQVIEKTPDLSDRLNTFSNAISSIQRLCFPARLSSIVTSKFKGEKGKGVIGSIQANAGYLAEFLERRRLNGEELESQRFSQQMLDMLGEKKGSMWHLITVRTLLHPHPMDNDAEMMLFNLIDDDDVDVKRPLVKRTRENVRIETGIRLIATFLMTQKEKEYERYKEAPRNEEAVIRAGLANIDYRDKTLALIRIAKELPGIDEKRLRLAREKREWGLARKKPSAVIETFIYEMHDKAMMHNLQAEEDTPMAEASSKPRFNMSDLCRLFRVSTEEPTADHLFAPIVDMRRQNNIADLPKEMGVTEREIKDFVARLDLTPTQWKEEIFPLLFDLGAELKLKERDLSVWKSSELSSELTHDDEWEDIEDDEDIAIAPELEEASKPARQEEAAKGSELNHVFFIRDDDAPHIAAEEYRLSDESLEAQQTCHPAVKIVSMYFPQITKRESWEDRQKNADEFNESLTVDEDAYMKQQELRLREEIEPTLEGKNPPSDACFRVGFAKNMGKGVYPVLSKAQRPGARMMFGGALLLTKKQRKNYIKKYGRDAYHQYAVTVAGNRKQRKFVWAPVGGGNDAQFFNTADLGVTSDPDKAHFKLRDVVIVMRNRRGQKRRIYAAYIDQVRQVPPNEQGLLYYGPKHRLKKDRSSLEEITLTPATPFTAAVLKAEWLTPEQIGEIHDYVQGRPVTLMPVKDEKYSNVKTDMVMAENRVNGELRSFVLELEADPKHQQGHSEYKLIRKADVKQAQWKAIADALDSADDILPAFTTVGKIQEALLKTWQRESGTAGTRANSPILPTAGQSSSAVTTRKGPRKRAAEPVEPPSDQQVSRSTRASRRRK